MSGLQLEPPVNHAVQGTPEALALAKARQNLMAARRQVRTTAAEARRWEDALLEAQEASRVAHLQLAALEGHLEQGRDETFLPTR